MSLEDKFDKIIKDKIGEADFPFEESNWHGASRMIDAERAAAGGAKSSKLFLLFGSLFLVIAGVTFFSLMTNTGGEKTIADNKDNVTNAMVSAANAAEVNASEVSSNASSVNETSSSNNISENNSAINSSNSKNANDVNYTSSNSSLTGDRVKGDKVMNNGADNGDGVKGEKVMNGGDGTKGDGVMNNGVGGNGTAKASKKSGNHSAGLQPYTMHYPQGKVKSNVVLNSKKQAPVDETASKSQEETLNASVNNDNSAESADYLNMRKSVLQIWNKDEVLHSNGFSFIRYDEDYFVHKRRNKYYLNAEIGTTYLVGWQTANGKDGAGLNGFAGLNFGVYLPKKIIVSVGAQVYNVSNINQPFYTQTRYDYDFGYTGTHTSITANSLIYASVPLKVSYPVTRKSRIGAGVNVGMLFSGISTVQTYNESDLVKSNMTETKVKGYYEGVNRMNTMVSVFYSYRLNRRFCVNGEAMLGLSDVYKNNVTNNGTFERNMGARLSLQYDIIHR
jgi:hypothetical protein